MGLSFNTLRTRGGPGVRDRTLSVNKLFFRKKSKNYLKNIFLRTSSSYAKILGETNFHAREIPRSGLKAKDGGEKRKKD